MTFARRRGCSGGLRRDPCHERCSEKETSNLGLSLHKGFNVNIVNAFGTSDSNLSLELKAPNWWQLASAQCTSRVQEFQ